MVMVKSLYDEITDDTAIIGMHPWPISVEDPYHLDVHI